MGYFDDRLEELQQGADDLAAGDEIRRTNQLLSILVEEIAGGQESYFESGFEEREPGESDDGRNTAVYTSRRGITASDSPQSVNFGLTADTVVIRNLGGPVGVAFKDPTQYDDAIITVTPDQTPFVLAGVYGISASKMWFESADTSEYDFDLLAVKKRGN
jgi:hypothetical protein